MHVSIFLAHHYQPPHSGRMEQAHNILQQHGSGVHGNQSLCDTGSPLQQRNNNTQNSRLQSEGSFGLGGPGAPGGEGADHALDVSGRLVVMSKRLENDLFRDLCFFHPYY